MNSMNFKTLLSESIGKNNSLVCVGLDTDINKITQKLKSLKAPLFEFNKAIINSTSNHVCSYKLNSAFYEAEGTAGIEQLKHTVEYIHKNCPNIPVILDAKRADIGNTNNSYAKFCFEYIGADAVTLHPYLGKEAIEPFLEYKDKGIIVLCRTSNPGAGEFQDLQIDNKKLYQIVASNVTKEWNYNNNCLLVAGALYPGELAEIRSIVGEDMTILVPGVGAQGGNVEEVVRAGINSYGSGIIINSSREIIYASDDEDFAKVAGTKAKELKEFINRYRYKNLVLDLLKIGAVKFGEFTLKSGIVSPIYLDLRVLVSHPEVMKSTAKAYSGLLENIVFDRMAAVPYAAMPIVAAVSAENSRPWIYTRKESKDYGTKKMIEGEYSLGERIVVVDDMTTNGASKLEVIGPFEKEGLKISDIVVLVDREQGAKGLLAKKGYKLHSVLPMSNILDILKDEEIIDQAMFDSVKEFLAKNSK